MIGLFTSQQSFSDRSDGSDHMEICKNDPGDHKDEERRDRSHFYASDTDFGQNQDRLFTFPAQSSGGH